ncbi:MAG TPA: heparinase II/III family protein [Planctomycetota bacterium]|nr:heparinase II/III family protein [Planctomycetota bacterium]
MSNRTFENAAAPEPNPRVADGAWAHVLGQHPCLFGPREFLRSLAEAKPDAYQEVRSLVDGDTTDWQKFRGSLLAAGIVHTVEGVRRDVIGHFIARAAENVARGVTNTHQDTWIWLEQVALTCDFFHEHIDRAQRRAMIEWMNAHLAVFTDDENAFHNSTLSKILCYLRIAYATWDENPMAKDFRAHAVEKLYEGRILPVLLEFGAGGGFTECGWYSRHCLWHLVQAFELARRLEGYDGYRKAPDFFYQRLAYEMLQPYPGMLENGCERYACEGDGTAAYSPNMEYPRLMRNVIAQYFRGSELSRYAAARRRPGSTPGIRLLDFLYEEPPDDPLDVTGFPLAHCARDVGKVYARGDWSDDATWLRFECGPWWNQHQHFEAGNFEIFRYEPLAAESGEYTDWDSPHAVNWLIRTVAHNCILVHQPDETWKNVRNRQERPIANDGGQADDTFFVHTLDEWQRRRERFERGHIVLFEDHGDFLHVVGDCTKAYAPSKVSLCLRQVVFLRPHTFVILDRVTATRAEYQKTWLLHCHHEPEIAGRTFTVTNGAGKLSAETLLPDAPVVRKVEGYTYGGETFEPESDRLSETAARWRIEVQPPAANTHDLFLHVLSTDGPKAAQLEREPDRLTLHLDGWNVRFLTGNTPRPFDLAVEHVCDRPSVP